MGKGDSFRLIGNFPVKINPLPSFFSGKMEGIGLISDLLEKNRMPYASFFMFGQSTIESFFSTVHTVDSESEVKSALSLHFLTTSVKG